MKECNYHPPEVWVRACEICNREEEEELHANIEHWKTQHDSLAADYDYVIDERNAAVASLKALASVLVNSSGKTSIETVLQLIKERDELKAKLEELQGSHVHETMDKGGINREYQIKDRPPDPPGIKND